MDDVTNTNKNDSKVTRIPGTTNVVLLLDLATDTTAMVIFELFHGTRTTLLIAAALLWSIALSADSNTTAIWTNCDEYVETQNFYDEEMNGIWRWNTDENAYRLNITDSTSFYVLMQNSSDQWDIYHRDEDGSHSDHLVYCQHSNLWRCTGEWWYFDDLDNEWVYDGFATSMLYNCSYNQCDLSTLMDQDTECMLLLSML